MQLVLKRMCSYHSFPRSSPASYPSITIISYIRFFAGNMRWLTASQLIRVFILRQICIGNRMYLTFKEILKSARKLPFSPYIFFCHGCGKTPPQAKSSKLEMQSAQSAFPPDKRRRCRRYFTCSAEKRFGFLSEVRWFLYSLSIFWSWRGFLHLSRFSCITGSADQG